VTTAQATGDRVGPPVCGVPVVELDNVSKVYPGPSPVRALDQASLAVTVGELVAVVGPSGSGKTTLLHLMGTLDNPTSGTVRVTGLDVAALGDRQLSALRASRIGFVFQQFFLAEHQTVLGNVADGLLYAGAGRWPSPRWPGSASGTRPPPAPPSYPAGNASGSRSPGPSLATRR